MMPPPRKLLKLAAWLRVFLVCMLMPWLFIGRVAAQAYSWHPAVVGGGGFVSGIIFHPTEPGLVYARTDVGGAYRLDNATSRWVALNDDIGGLSNEFMHLGVLSLGLDPADANRVYLATGQYTGTETWKPFSRFYRSTDRGATWSSYITLPFKMGGNQDGRGTGERIAVDPVNGLNIVIGTSDAGLWRSTDRGSTWTRMTNFTPTAVNFVRHLPRPAGATGPSPVYAGAATLTAASLWRSDDGGTTWTAVANQPGRVAGSEMMALQGAFDAAGVFYTTWAAAPGPNGGIGLSQVWKLAADGATWTQIQPPTGQGGFGGIAADPRVAGHVVVSTLQRWYPRDEVYRSTNGGATWTAVLTGATRSVGNSPWSSANTPHWMTDIEIDPFNSERVIFNTGYGLFQTTNLTASGTARTWTFFNDGLEELVGNSVLSPTAGPPLISVVGDQTGFRHDDLNRSPLRGRMSPGGVNSSVTGADLAPAKMIRQSSTATLFSQDAGATWAAFPTEPPPVANGDGRIALSADGSRILWCPVNAAAYFSTDNGATWSVSNGPSAASTVSLTPLADRVDSLRFYLWDSTAKQWLTSTDGGANFTLLASGLNSAFSQFTTVPANTGHVWVAAGSSGLYKSTNFGATFTKLASVTEVYRFDFGRAAPSALHPAIYIWGKVGGVVGFFRSIDTGATWTRINDDLHEFGYINDLAGDPRTYGRVYLATSGRGLVIGEISTSPPSVATQLVFDDAVQNGWANASAADTSLTSTSPVRRGTKAVAVPAGTGKGVAFTCAARTVQGAAAVSFWLNGGAVAPPPLQVGAARGGIALEAAPITVAATIGWQRVVVPLADFGVANVDDLTGLRIESRASVAFFVDDLALVGSTDFATSTATLTLGNLTATYDGTPKLATVTTTPANLNALVTYNSSAAAPSAAGTYSVAANIDDAFFTGSANGTLTIQTQLEHWRFLNFATTANTGTAADLFDANGDGEKNLMEFATAQNPLAVTTARPSLVKNGATLEFTYTRSLAALLDGVTFVVEWSDTLLNDWSTAGVGAPSVLSDNGITQQIKVTVPAGAGVMKRFIHLKVTSP